MATHRETPTPPEPVAAFLTAAQSWIDSAADHYANAEHANADLADAYVTTSVEYPHGYVAGLHQTIGYHLKAGALAAAIAAAVVAEESARFPAVSPRACDSWDSCPNPDHQDVTA